MKIWIVLIVVILVLAGCSIESGNTSLQASGTLTLYTAHGEVVQNVEACSFTFGSTYVRWRDCDTGIVNQWSNGRMLLG